MTPNDIQNLRTNLESSLHQTGCILQIDKVAKYSIMQYQKEKAQFLKIFVSHPKFVSQLKSVIEKGVMFCGQQGVLSEITYESNMPYALRFMIDNEIGGMTWVKIERKHWQIRSRAN